MRPPAGLSISAPMIPNELGWVNVATLRMDQQRGRPVLLEFSDLLRPSSLRANDYLRRWHSVYGDGPQDLRVITVFAPWLPFSADEACARSLVERAGIEHAVLLDLDLDLWQIYENEGWPSRYLFDRELRLVDYHRGEGGYEETERAIRESLGVDPAGPVELLHSIDDPELELVVPTPDQPGDWSGAYEAGEVWAVFEGSGSASVNGVAREIIGPGPELLIGHEHHAAGELDLQTGTGLTCHAVCFSPGTPSPA